MQARANYNKLNALVTNMPSALREKDFPEGTLNRNVRDVLAHVHAWHLLFLDWYTVGMTGNKPAMPAEGHSWRTLPNLNREIRDRYAKLTTDDAISLLKQSFNTLIKLIELHSEDDLFTKAKYSWTGSTSMGAYLISATSSHYHWAYELIVKAKKEEAL